MQLFVMFQNFKYNSYQLCNTLSFNVVQSIFFSIFNTQYHMDLHANQEFKYTVGLEMDNLKEA
jgi:hypothetical protein